MHTPKSLPALPREHSSKMGMTTLCIEPGSSMLRITTTR